MGTDRRQAGSGQMRRGGRSSATVGSLAPSSNFGSLLHAHYNVDSFGGTWVDKTGHGFDLTLTGPPDTEASKFDSLAGVRFNDGAERADTSSLTGIAAGSRPWVMAFARQANTGSTWGTFNISSDGTFANSGFALWGAASAGIAIDKDTGSSTSNAPCDKSLPFLAIQGLRASALVVGFNGDLTYELDTAGAKTLDDAQTRLRLGQLYAGGFGGNGWINDFLMLASPPTEVQIRKHYEWLAQQVPSFGTAIGLDHANRGVVVVIGQSNGSAIANGYGSISSHFYSYGVASRPAGIRYRSVTMQSRDLHNDFKKNSVTYPDLYPKVIEAISQAASNDTVSILWLQGEADASDATKAAAYQTNLTTFISDVEADSGRSDIFWGVSRLSNAQTTCTELATVQGAMDAVVAALPARRAIFNTDDLVCPDNTHYDTASLAEIWERFRDIASTHYGTANW